MKWFFILVFLIGLIPQKWIDRMKIYSTGVKKSDLERLKESRKIVPKL